jgi:hypothetical protein
MKLIYPSLLQSSNVKLESHSWFDIIKYDNPKKIKKKQISIKTSYIDTTKIKIFPKKRSER